MCEVCGWRAMPVGQVDVVALERMPCVISEQHGPSRLEHVTAIH